MKNITSGLPKYSPLNPFASLINENSSKTNRALTAGCTEVAQESSLPISKDLATTIPSNNLPKLQACSSQPACRPCLLKPPQSSFHGSLSELQTHISVPQQQPPQVSLFSNQQLYSNVSNLFNASSQNSSVADSSFTVFSKPSNPKFSNMRNSFNSKISQIQNQNIKTANQCYIPLNNLERTKSTTSSQDLSSSAYSNLHNLKQSLNDLYVNSPPNGKIGAISNVGNGMPSNGHSSETYLNYRDMFSGSPKTSTAGASTFSDKTSSLTYLNASEINDPKKSSVRNADRSELQNPIDDQSQYANFHDIITNKLIRAGFPAEPDCTLGNKKADGFGGRKNSTEKKQKSESVMKEMPGTTREESRKTLEACNWSVRKAVQKLKLNKLCELGVASEQRCLALLEKYDWNLKKAVSVMFQDDSIVSSV